MKRLTYIIYLLLLATNSFAQGHFIPAFTGKGQDHMNLYVVTASIGGIALKAGDEIAAFDGAICCGVTILEQPIVVTSSNTFAVVKASREDAGLLDGYTVGHTITYKFWDASWNNGTGRELSGISAEYFDNTISTIPAPTYTANGTAFVRLTVAEPTNQLPTADAGPDQSVNEGTIVTLDGTASNDPESSPLTYIWTPPTGITLSSATASKPTFTAPEVNADTQYTFSLVVNDGTVNSIANQVIITVKQINKTPIANAGSDQSVNEGVTVTLDGTASNDPDSNPLTYLWTPPAGITLSSATASKPTFTAPEVNADTQYAFSLVVNDGTVNSTSNQVIITVKQVNKAPVANAGPDQSVNENVIYTLNGSESTDPDGDPLTYKWTAPAGITLSSLSAAKPTFTAPAVTVNTNYTFTLVVNDGKVDSPADQVTITVKRENQSPTANAGPDQSVNEGVIVTLDGTASNDPDSDPLTYLWSPPPGITLSSTTASKPTFTAPEVSADIQYAFSLVVNDGTVNSTANQVIITVKQVNKAPVANAGTDQSVNGNVVYTLDGSASTDPDGDALTYKWTAPAGITLSSLSAAKPTFTAPAVTVSTNYTFTLVVNDGKVDSPADQVTITVKRENQSPTANAGPDQSVNEGAIVTLDGTASNDPDSDPLTYLWSPPPGITLSSTTASKPTFTAPEVSADTQYAFSLVVNDGTVNSTADQVIIIVKQVNKAPVANAGPDQSVNGNIVYTLDGSASTDPDGDALTYKWTAPAGITLSSLSTAKPTFTAPAVTVNTNYTFTLVVNDGKTDSPADQVTITVKQGNQSPTANAGPNQSVNEGVIVVLDGTASNDPDSDPLTYLWTPPAGIILSSTTASKPTFTAPEVNADTQYSFSLVVNDGTVISAADQVIITVISIDKPPYVKDPIENVSVDKRSPNQIIDLKTVFADDDLDDILIYSVTSNSNDQVVTATITGFNLTLSFSAENTGSAEVVITASSNGKEANSTFMVEVKMPTGINSMISSQKMLVYPNPTSGEIKIVFEGIPQNGNTLTVTDETGKTILKKNIQYKEEWINLKGNPPGLYLIKSSLNKTTTQKVIFY